MKLIDRGVEYIIGALVVFTIVGALAGVIVTSTTGSTGLGHASFATVKTLAFLVPLGIIVSMLMIGFNLYRKRKM